MVGNFHIQASIPKWGKKTSVNWNKNDVKKAVVFIHGFNGSAANTFGNFNLEFRFRQEYEEYDVYFYNYDSLFTQIPYSALKFLDFLKAIHNKVDDVIRESRLSINRSFQYEKIVIVAHSLGAVVSRYALNKGHKTEPWLSKCHLILFAPAHKGARDEILNFSFPGPLGLISPALRFFVTTIKQLMNTSIIIAPMESECSYLISQKVKSFTVAKRVVWAQYERVVINDYFSSDPDPDRLDGKHHTEVCKPDQYFQEPYNIVANVL